MPWQRELSSRGAGHRVHCEAESFLTCYKHTFMSHTCQCPYSSKNLDFLGATIVTTLILIRARLVVQVHPGPVNTRRFSLSPLSGLSLKKPFCQPFVNFTIGRMAVHSGR